MLMSTSKWPHRHVSSNAVSEDASIGTEVGITAFAEDLDAADSVTYSLTNDAGGLFAINSNSGVVSVNASLDYETSQQHTITVQALSTDQSTQSSDFTISIANVEGQPFVSFPKTLVPFDSTRVNKRLGHYWVKMNINILGD